MGKAVKSRRVIVTLVMDTVIPMSELRDKDWWVDHVKDGGDDYRVVNVKVLKLGEYITGVEFERDRP